MKFHGILLDLLMEDVTPQFFAELLADFAAPIAALDCGSRCAPYNEHGVPFCCDVRHAVPTAYAAEWDYLRGSTDLWQLWQEQYAPEMQDIVRQVPDGQLLIACRGVAFCQREFRSLSCCSFPFYPYVTRQGEFIGLSYHWSFRNLCWVISNLQVVSLEYLTQFVRAYDALFVRQPAAQELQRQYSGMMRRIFGRHHRSIPVFHRNGCWYKVTPRNGRLRRAVAQNFSKYGDYQLAAELPFPAEQESQV